MKNLLAAIILASSFGAAHGIDVGLLVGLLCLPVALMAELLFTH